MRDRLIALLYVHKLGFISVEKLADFLLENGEARTDSHRHIGGSSPPAHLP